MKILEEKIFEKERKYYEEILNSKHDYTTESVYEINIIKIIEYTLEFVSDIFAGYRYFETKEESEKNAIASLFQKKRDFLKNKISIFNKISLGKNNIYKILNELRLIRNLLMHLKYETLSGNIREEIRISYIKNFKDEETKEIWNIIHKLYNKLKKEIIEQFNFDVRIYYGENGITYLIDREKSFEISPFIIVKNNKVYSLSVIKRKSKKERGFETTVSYDSLDETIDIKEDNIIDKINNISQSLKYSIELETNKYLYLNEEFQIIPSLYRYDNSKDDIICELKAETVNPNKIIFEEKYVLSKDKKSQEFSSIRVKIAEDEREKVKMKISKMIYPEKSKEKELKETEEYDIEKRQKGEIKIELHITKSREIKDNIKKDAKLVITNTGNIKKTSKIVLKSHRKIFIYKSDNTELKKGETLTIHLEPKERKIIDFYFIPKIFGEEIQRANQKCGVLKKAIYIGMMDENNKSKGEWNRLNIYKRFEPTELIDREKFLSLIQNELRKENTLKINDYMIWYIMGDGGVGKTKFRETVASIAHEYGYNVLEIPVKNSSKINQDSKTANYLFTESILRKSEKTEEDFDLNANIKCIQEKTKEEFEEKIEEYLKEYIIRKINKAEKGIFIIIDDCQYIQPIEKKIIGDILNYLNEYETVKDIKVLLLSRMDKEPIKAEMITEPIPTMEGFDKKEDVEEMIKNIFDPNNFPPEFVEDIMTVPKHLPFYLKRFLQILYMENKIYYKDGKWNCSLDKIHNEDFKTDYLIKAAKNKRILNILMHLIAIFPEQSYENTRTIMKELGYEDIDITNGVEELKNIDIVKQEEEKLYLSHDITTENIENSFEDKLLKELIDKLMKKSIDSVETIENMDDLDKFIELMDRLIIIHKMIEKINDPDYLYDYAVKMLDVEEKIFYNTFTHQAETDIRKFNYYMIIEKIQNKLESEKYGSNEKIQKLIRGWYFKCTKTDSTYFLLKLNFDYYHPEYEFYLNEKYNIISKYYSFQNFTLGPDKKLKIRYLLAYVLTNTFVYNYKKEEKKYIEIGKNALLEIESEINNSNMHFNPSLLRLKNIVIKQYLCITFSIYNLDYTKNYSFIKEKMIEIKEEEKYKSLLRGHYLRIKFTLLVSDFINIFNKRKKPFSITKNLINSYFSLVDIIKVLNTYNEEMENSEKFKRDINYKSAAAYYFIGISFLIIISQRTLLFYPIKKHLKIFCKNFDDCINLSSKLTKDCEREFKNTNNQDLPQFEMRGILMGIVILKYFKKGNKKRLLNETKKELDNLLKDDKNSFKLCLKIIINLLKDIKRYLIFVPTMSKDLKTIINLLDSYLKKIENNELRYKK